MAIDRIELKQIGLPRDMQRNMASEAEAKVQARAKVVASEGESRANNRLVEAGDSLDVVSIHLRSGSNVNKTKYFMNIILRYLQTMMKINHPLNSRNQGYILPFPLEMLKLKKSFVNFSLKMLDQLIRNTDLSNSPKRQKKTE